MEISRSGTEYIDHYEETIFGDEAADISIRRTSEEFRENFGDKHTHQLSLKADAVGEGDYFENKPTQVLTGAVKVLVTKRHLRDLRDMLNSMDL